MRRKKWAMRQTNSVPCLFCLHYFYGGGRGCPFVSIQIKRDIASVWNSSFYFKNKRCYYRLSSRRTNQKIYIRGESGFSLIQSIIRCFSTRLWISGSEYFFIFALNLFKRKNFPCINSYKDLYLDNSSSFKVRPV